MWLSDLNAANKSSGVCVRQSDRGEPEFLVWGFECEFSLFLEKAEMFYSSIHRLVGNKMHGVQFMRS